MSSLNPEKAYIFRITHTANLPWILEHGLHCPSSNTIDPDHHDIGNPELIQKRANRPVPIPPSGTLSDYIPFYFTPYSPMLYNIKTGYAGMKKLPMSDIVILVSSLRILAAQSIPFVFTDRHAYLQTASFFPDLSHLDRIPWALLQARDFRRDPEHPEKMERYQAEALIHQHLPVAALAGIVCYGPARQAGLQMELEKRGSTLKAVAKPN